MFCNILVRNYRSKFNRIQSNISTTASLCKVGDKFKLPKRFNKVLPSIWIEYTNLAIQHKPANLGLGFPDFAPPPALLESFLKTAQNKSYTVHQYTRAYGHPPLVTALSKIYSKLLGFDINPLKEMLITIGGYEGIYTSIHGFVEAGDEVIIMEPFFSPYYDVLTIIGAVPKLVPILPKENADPLCSCNWSFDECTLQNAFSEKTKLIILNNPHNPVGKAFTLQELQFIATLCKKWNVVCISDEVYEWLVYEPAKHIRIASLPEMWERTVTLGSSGKAICATGWKIGWAYGPEHLIGNLQMVHQSSIYTCSTPLQESLAPVFEQEFANLGKDESFFCSQRKLCANKRDFFVETLTEAGLLPVMPDGGFFLIADWTKFAPDANLDSEKDPSIDYRFTKWMIKNVNVLGIPISVFYAPEDKCLGQNYMRFCFIKTDNLLKEVKTNLQKWKNKSKNKKC